MWGKLTRFSTAQQSGNNRPAEASHTIIARMKSAVGRSKDLVYVEIRETRVLYDDLVRWGRGETLSRQEKMRAREQLLDICKAIPALAIFVAPFGSLLLVFLIKVLPFNILPSAFLRDRRKSPGFDSDLPQV